MLPKASESNFWHYNAQLKERARELRNKSTKSEACLWKYVLRGRAYGVQFSRQRPILRYIVDFVCLELMLVRELDGLTHQNPTAVKSDAYRQGTLESIGFKVIRFTDSEVLSDIKNVERAITKIVSMQKLALNWKSKF